MSASSAKHPRKLIADLPKGVSARWVTDGSGRRSVCVRLGQKYSGRKAERLYFPTRQEAEEWLNGSESKKSKADSTGIVEIFDYAKEAGVAKERLDPDELRKAIMAYRTATDHGVSVSEAVVDKIKKIAPSGKPRTLREACDEVISTCQATGKSARHIKLMRGIYDRFCVKLGQRPLHSIEDEELEAWRDSCRDLSLRTLRNYFNYLAIVFQRGIRKGWCKENPAAGIKAEILELPRDVTILTAHEMARLLGAAWSLRKELVAPLALKAFAGIRTSELLRLTWGEIKNSAVHIERRKAKTKRARHITHQSPLPAWLKAVKLAEKTGSSFVVQMQEKPFHQGIAVLAKAAGVKVGSNALRHSFGTYYYHKHKNAPQTAYLMGNSVGVVERDYVHYAPEEGDVDLWWRITPAVTRKAYANQVDSKKVGTAVAKKKRSKGARILFSEKKPAGKSGAGQSRKAARSATAAKKSSRRTKTRR